MPSLIHIPAPAASSIVPNFAWGLKNIGTFTGDVIFGRDVANLDDEDGYTASEYLAATPSGNLEVVTLYNQGTTALSPELGQGSSAAQPTGYDSGTRETDSNGNPVLKFDGVDDCLLGSATSLLNVNTGVSPEHSIILVCEFDTVPSAQEVFYEFRKLTDSDDLCRFQYNSTDNELQILYRDPDRTMRYDETCGAISANTQYIIEIYVGSVLNVYVNGTQVVTNVAQATTKANAPDAFGYGANASGTNNWFNGAIKEVQIFDSNKLSDRAAIYTGVSGRWS